MRVTPVQIADAAEFSEQTFFLLAGMITHSHGVAELLALPLRPGRKIYLSSFGRGKFGVGYSKIFSDDLLLCRCPDRPFTPESAYDVAWEMRKRVVG